MIDLNAIASKKSVSLAAETFLALLQARQGVLIATQYAEQGDYDRADQLIDLLEIIGNIKVIREYEPAGVIISLDC